MAVKTLKDLTLRLDDGTGAIDEAHCQLTRAALVDNPDTEDIVTFCEKSTFSSARYTVELSGFVDWGAAESVFDMLHTSYRSFQDDGVADLPLDFEISVGGQFRSGQLKPQNDVPFGGDAGSAMTADITCDVLGDVAETALTP